MIQMVRNIAPYVFDAPALSVSYQQADHPEQTAGEERGKDNAEDQHIVLAGRGTGKTVKMLEDEHRFHKKNEQRSEQEQEEEASGEKPELMSLIYDSGSPEGHTEENKKTSHHKKHNGQAEGRADLDVSPEQNVQRDVSAKGGDRNRHAAKMLL